MHLLESNKTVLFLSEKGPSRENWEFSTWVELMPKNQPLDSYGLWQAMKSYHSSPHPHPHPWLPWLSPLFGSLLLSPQMEGTEESLT